MQLQLPHFNVFNGEREIGRERERGRKRERERREEKDSIFCLFFFETASCYAA
jgi:hypothetical protein